MNIQKLKAKRDYIMLQLTGLCIVSMGAIALFFWVINHLK